MTKAAQLQSPFLAFVREPGDITALQAFAEQHDWADSCIMQGDIRTASEFLKNHSSPQMLLVDIPSAAEAPALLDALAEVCDPETKVIVSGTVNEYSFYVWLLEIGIFSYLLKPLTLDNIESAYEKMQSQQSGASKGEKQLGKVVAVTGTRGGVGATTVAISLAGIYAEYTRKNIALVDIDPQEGSIALALDIEPSRGLRDALEKPDRIDSLFMERVMSKPRKNLSVLSAEESLLEQIHAGDHAADTLLKELREKFDIVIIDVPRTLDRFTRKCLSLSDQIVLVTELTLISLRDALRLNELLRDSMKTKPPVVVANRVGLAAKQEIVPADFEKATKAKIAFKVPFAPDIFMEVSNEIPAVKSHAKEQVKPLFQLAQSVWPDVKIKMPGSASDQRSASMLGGLIPLPKFGAGKPKSTDKEGG